MNCHLFANLHQFINLCKYTALFIKRRDRNRIGFDSRYVDTGSSAPVVLVLAISVISGEFRTISRNAGCVFDPGLINIIL